MSAELETIIKRLLLSCPTEGKVRRLRRRIVRVKAILQMARWEIKRKINREIGNHTK